MLLQLDELASGVGRRDGAIRLLLRRWARLLRRLIARVAAITAKSAPSSQTTNNGEDNEGISEDGGKRKKWKHISKSAVGLSRPNKGGHKENQKDYMDSIE